MYPRLPPRMFGANCLFSTHWREGSTASTFVLRNLEPKFLKTENLGGLVGDTRAGRDAASLRREHTYKDRLADWEK